MAIDRIGKGGVGMDPAGVRGVREERASPPANEAARPFTVAPSEKPRGGAPAEASHAAAVKPAEPPLLERLRAGELDLREYLNAKVEEATAHLRGMAGPELDEIKAALRDRLTSDPALAELAELAEHARHE